MIREKILSLNDNTARVYAYSNYLEERVNRNPSDFVILSYNTKTNKNQKEGYKTASIHLSPGGESKAFGGFDLCANKGACEESCLNNSGCHAMPYQQVKRIGLTLFLKHERGKFLERLKNEITAFKKSCDKEGYNCAIRPNALSDLRWLGEWVSENFPSVQVYDYTKNPVSKRYRDNYDLTFSFSETKKGFDNSIEALKNGYRVAVVFDCDKESFPETFMGFKVINGDNNDLRFLEPGGVIVGLSLKGVNKAKERARITGFAVKKGYEPLAIF